jgi:hypothetical protein
VRLYNKRGTAEQWIKVRKASGKDDAVELPSVPIQRGAPAADRDCVQPREPVAPASAAEEDWELVADELAAAIGEDNSAREFEILHPFMNNPG